MSLSRSVSYAHENKDWITKLGLDQKPESTESASFWLDQKRLHSGDRWTDEAAQALKRATAAVLLISRKFLNSQSIMKNEAPEIIRRFLLKEISVVFVPIGRLDIEEVGNKLGLDNIAEIISIPAWDDPLPMRAEEGHKELREQIISAVTEPKEVQDLRRTLAKTDRYSLGDRIGEGHSSTLFTANERDLNRTVLIKLLRTPEHYKQFRTAVSHVAHASNHTNMLSIYASYFYSEPPHYIVRYVLGAPLHAILNESRAPIDFVKHVITAIGSAVSHAHRHGVSRINLKPCNIVVSDHYDRRKRNMFLDLNSYDETTFLSDENWRTNRDDILYLPLEYRRTTPYWDDPQSSDQYRLGIIAYEMLIGSTRFKELAEPLRQVDFSSDNWHWPALAEECKNCPSYIMDLVDRMVKTNPNQRYATIDEAIAGVETTDLIVETVRDSYRRVMESEQKQLDFFRSFYENLITDPEAARHFPKEKFGPLGHEFEPGEGWIRQFQALKQAVLLLIVFKAFREEGREPNILTRIVEEHARRKVMSSLYSVFGEVLIKIVLEKDPEAQIIKGELKQAWESVIQPGIEYMVRRSDAIERADRNRRKASAAISTT